MKVFTLRWNFPLLVIIASFLLSSCLKDKYNPKRFVPVDWETALGVPIATVNITIANILKDDSTLTIGNDGAVKIVFRNDTIAQQSVGDILEIPSQDPSSINMKLGAIQISNFNSAQTVELGQLTNSLSNAATGAAIQNVFGLVAPFPPIPEQSGGNYQLPLIDEFQTVSFSQGNLIFELSNGFPTTLDSVVFAIGNTGASTPFGFAPFGNVLPDSTQTRSISLAGLTMSRDLTFTIIKIVSGGNLTNPDTIKSTMALTISIGSDSLEVIGGSVKIPSQQFDGDTTIIDFATTDNEEIYTIDLATGSIDFTFQSSIAEEIQLDISIPGILRNNVPLNQTITIPPDSTINASISLVGARLDLTTQSSQPYNQLSVLIAAALNGSGNFVTIDSSDGLAVSYGINNINFDLVRGYFGQKNIQIDESELELNLSFLRELGGSIYLANPKIDLNVVNGIGAPIQLTLDMEGKTTDGRRVSLNAPAQTLPFPTVPYTTASGPISYDRNNSRLDSLLSLPPDTLTTGGLIRLNPNGNVGTNFIASSSEIKIGLEADLPFEFAASGIGFGDTADFDGSSLDGVVEAKLKFRNTSRFPFDLTLEIKFLDSAYNLLHELSAPLIQAAQVDANGRVIAANTAPSEIALSRAAVQAIKPASKMIFRLKMSTANSGQQVIKLYTDYDLILRMGLEATIRVSDLIGGN